MTLRVVPPPEDDDELDAIALRDVDPPTVQRDLGYQEAEAPRRRKPVGPTFWTFVEREGQAPAGESGSIGGSLVCKPKTATWPGCGEPAAVLHADPRSSTPERSLCSRCTGIVMRERMGALTPRGEGGR